MLEVHISLCVKMSYSIVKFAVKSSNGNGKYLEVPILYKKKSTKKVLFYIIFVIRDQISKLMYISFLYTAKQSFYR